MYWMLLPLDANAGRHFTDEKGLTRVVWTALLRSAWQRTLHLFVSGRN
jgi:hypothetical protein